MRPNPFATAAARPATGRSGFARLLAGVLMLAQLFVVGAVPILDAEAGHHQPVAAHFEDAQQSDCPASHDASSCQLCQLVASVRALPASAAAAPQPLGQTASVPASAREVRVVARALERYPSRAPPLG